MRYSRIAARIDLIKSIGYRKIPKMGMYQIIWAREGDGKLFQKAHYLGSTTLASCSIECIQRICEMEETKAIEELRKAVITDGLSFEEED